MPPKKSASPALTGQAQRTKPSVRPKAGSSKPLTSAAGPAQSKPKTTAQSKPKAKAQSKPRATAQSKPKAKAQSKPRAKPRTKAKAKGKSTASKSETVDPQADKQNDTQELALPQDINSQWTGIAAPVTTSFGETTVAPSQGDPNVAAPSAFSKDMLAPAGPVPHQGPISRPPAGGSIPEKINNSYRYMPESFGDAIAGAVEREDSLSWEKNLMQRFRDRKVKKANKGK